jgi:NAD(P)-dependent dehydrogenase (short-subunit alcohol dehydrogenase family)
MSGATNADADAATDAAMNAAAPAAAPAAASGRRGGLHGEVALVTGALGAIGSAVAAALAAEGARVVAADSQARAHWHAVDLGRPEAPAVRLDVTDRAAVQGLVRRIRRQLGPVTVLVNVAGVVSFGSAEALAETEWDRVIDINLKGTFLACQAVMPGMREARRGRIVNIGSLVGKNAGNARPWLDPQEQARAGNVAYGVSKAGVHAMTGFLAKELAAHGITVNAVAPGPVATSMTAAFPDALRQLIPVGRMSTAQDVAAAVLFLAGGTAGAITGEVLDVNGGMHCD